jgi:AhpD family alkylhydroperoxidase
VTWLPESASGATGFDQVFGLHPDLYEPYRHFAGLFWARRLVDPVLLELARLRVATLLRGKRELHQRVDVARDAGVTEAVVAALPDWPTSPAFTEAQRRGLAFAELFVMDPTAITDADRERLRADLSEPGFIAFVEALALFDGFTRFQVILGIGPEADAVCVVSLPDPGPAPAGAAPSDDGDAVAHSPLALQPETLVAFQRLYGTLWSHGDLPQSLKETARLRNARVTGCNYCKAVRFAGAQADGLTEDQIARIDDGHADSDLSPEQKAVLRFTDAFLTDPGAFRAEDQAELARLFTAPQIVELAAGVALFMGFSKIAVSMAEIPELPVMVVPTPDWQPA